MSKTELISKDELRANFGIKEDPKTGLCTGCPYDTQSIRVLCNGPERTTMDICQIIDDTEPVEAIPVEFIESRANSYATGKDYPADLYAAGVLEVLIFSWRKQQNET